MKILIVFVYFYSFSLCAFQLMDLPRIPVDFDRIVTKLVESAEVHKNPYSDYEYDFHYLLHSRFWFIPFIHGTAGINFKGSFHDINDNGLDTASKHIRISDVPINGQCRSCDMGTQTIDINFAVQAFENKVSIKSSYPVFIKLYKDRKSGHIRIFVNEELAIPEQRNVIVYKNKMQIFFRDKWYYSGNSVGIDGIFELEIYWNKSLDMNLYFHPDTYNLRRKLAYFHKGKLVN